MTFAVSLPPSALLQEGATDGQAIVWDDGLGIFRPQNVNEVEELTVSGLTSGRVVGTSTGGLLVDNATAGLELRAPSLTIRNPNVSNASSVIFQNVNGTQLAQVGSASDGTGLLSTYYTLNITGYSSGSGDAVTIWGGSVPTRIVRFNTTGTVFDLTVSCPGTDQFSERFGAESVATGYGSTSIGAESVAAAYGSISIGRSVSCDVASQLSVGIGYDTQINRPYVTLVGSLSANYSGLATTGLGYRTSPVHEASICLGAWSVSSTANQCTIGSTTYPVNALRLVSDGSGSTLNLGVASGILTITASGGAIRIPQGHILSLSGQYGDSLYGVGSGPLTINPYWGVRIYGSYPAGYDSDAIPAFHIDTSSANDSADIFRITNNSSVRFKITPAGRVGIGYAPNPTLNLGAKNPVASLNVYGASGEFSSSDKGVLSLANDTGVGMHFGGYGSYPFGQWIQAGDAVPTATPYPLLLNPIGGHVGIGTTNPTAKLEVAGTIYSSTTGTVDVLRWHSSSGLKTWGISLGGVAGTDGFRIVEYGVIDRLILTSGSITFNAAITFGTTLTYDIGSASSYARNVYASSYMAAAGGVFWFNTRSTISSPGDGYLQLGDYASGTGSSFVMLAFGPSGTSHPALKRSSATLQVRLANDSGYATFACGPTLLVKYDDTYYGALTASSAGNLILEQTGMSGITLRAPGSVVQKVTSTNTNTIYTEYSYGGGSSVLFGTRAGVGFVQGSDATLSFEVESNSGGGTLLWGFKANGLLCAVGLTSSYPAFKRNGTTMEVRLADDSGYAPLKASTLYATEHLTLGTDTNVYLGYGRALTWSSSGNSYNSFCAIVGGLGDTLSIQATELTLTSTAGPVRVGSNLYPVTDDIYYLGKNDDDSPKAWKGIILKDQTTGTYYRVQIDSGVLTLVDLTD